jgi:hypothetical protein
MAPSRKQVRTLRRFADTRQKEPKKTAIQLGEVSKDEMKVANGTITKIDKGTKTFPVKSAEMQESWASRSTGISH